MFAHSVKMKKPLSVQIEMVTWLYKTLGDRGGSWDFKYDCFSFKNEKDMTAFSLRWAG